LATEAARLAAGWAWDALELDQLIHLIQPGNDTSVRVAEKLGASFDHRMSLDGLDADVYVLTRPTDL
jgi:RimJ/RimL family protein N-acetyltransferase